MSFFYDLNKKLDSIRATPEVTHQQLNERDMSRAAKGYEKYGREGMEALAKAGRDGKALDPVRKKYDKYDNEQVDEKVETFRSDNTDRMVNTVKTGKGPFPTSQDTRDSYAKDVRAARAAGTLKKDSSGQRSGVAPSGRKIEIDNFEEGMMDTAKKVGKTVASGVNKLVGHGSDEDMRKDLQRKSGAPVTGKKPEQRGMSEAAGPLDFDKVLDAIAALYGDDIWDNDAMQDLANDLEQAGPTDRELDFIIAKGRLPKRLAGIQFSAGDSVRFGESSAPMTAKQKSFAALAPPADKITFADKIAGAKKEVDEMLGDVAAEAMRGALSGGQKKLDKNHNGKLDANDFAMLRKGGKKGHGAEMGEEKSAGTAFDMNTPRQVAPKVGSTERGHKHDIKHTATGRMVTRRTDDQGNSVGADDASDAQAEPRGRGRPKGTKGAIGAKGPSGKSKLMTKEGDNESSELKDAMALLKKSGYKVTKNEGSEQELDEKAVSKKQQRFMGMVHATQKGEKPASRAVDKVANTMKKKDAEDFASTKHKGLPEKAPKKKKEESVDESGTTAGSVATSTASKGGGGIVGKGIYDSMNRELEQMIAESMSINMSDSTEGGKSLTITATDEDALKLGMMLKNAGLGSGDAHGDDMHSSGEEPCPTCGMPDCGCGDVQQAVDENAPDWPTNTETSPDALQYSGGLNKPKADVAGDGQSTVPVVATRPNNDDDMRRMMEMAGIKQDELDPSKETMKEEVKDTCNDCHKDPCECDKDIEEDFLESIQRMREIAGIREAKKPDFLDMDKDGDKKEPMKQAVKDKEEKKVDESIFALTNQWKAYKG